MEPFRMKEMQGYLGKMVPCWHLPSWLLSLDSKSWALAGAKHLVV
jgi:hypothetical protein